VDNFWIIPILAMIAGCIIGAGAIEYKVNTIWPNAIIELDEIKSMSCEEAKEKNASGRYLTPSNGIKLRSMVDACPDAAKKDNSGLSPYVEFCTPGGFVPDKKIDNSTHSFDHDTCQWFGK